MAKAKKKMNPLEKVAKRYNVTTRELRDIVTAVSTIGRASTNKDITRTNEGYPFNQLNVTKRDRKVGTIYKGSVKSKAGRNLAKQVGEVYTAVTKGKSGTKSAQLKSKKDKTGATREINYALETKRKQGRKK